MCFVECGKNNACTIYLASYAIIAVFSSRERTLSHRHSLYFHRRGWFSVKGVLDSRLITNAEALISESYKVHKLNM